VATILNSCQISTNGDCLLKDNATLFEDGYNYTMLMVSPWYSCYFASKTFYTRAIVM